MSTTEATAPTPSSGGVKSALSLRKNGKNWHAPRKAFRPTASLTSYTKRKAAEQAAAVIKATETEMKAEKAQLKAEHVARIRDRRAKKEERERWEKLEEKMHHKRVERLKRREKRNKLLNS